MSPKSVTGARLPSLDGWRCVAIALVIVSHWPYARGFPASSWNERLVRSGDLGVRVFFVISGLLITYLLLTEGDRRGRPSLQAFYLRRVLRIFPVYFLYIAVLAALTAIGLYSDAWSSWIGTLTFTRNIVGRGNSVTVHYWSLAVEEQFYFVWPLMLVLFGLWRRPRLAAGVLLLPLLLCPVVRAGLIQTRWPNPSVVRALGTFSIARYADSLAIGALAAFVYRASAERVHEFASRTVLAAALTVFIVITAFDGSLPNWLDVWTPTIQGLAVACAILVTIERSSGGVYWFLNTRPITWIGTLSYSVYVWQQLFLGHFAGPRLAALPMYDWRMWWLTALVCACISYCTVERPILKVRDRLRDRLFETTPWIPQTRSIPAENTIRQTGSLRATPSGLVD
jgi:peptidoglycan/LPS O-acetylase OafA/YrhL